MFFAAKDGEALYSQQKQGRELTVAQIMSSLLQKFRLILKKVGKTTRPLRYDLNQTSCDYTVEVINRLKGLDLINKVHKELWQRFVTLKAVTKTMPKKKKCKKASGCLRRFL